MFAIIGIVVVFGAVIGGFLMEHGKLPVLVQPSEFIIIGVAASGTLLIANPLRILKKIGAGFASVFKESPFSKERYLTSLKMLYDVFNRARREGLVSLEADADNPEKSVVFSKYPDFLANEHFRAFVCDTLRMASSGGVDAFDLDQMMELDMEVHHEGAVQPVAALTTVADSLPGLGIVAAVLGVVITMGSLGGPPEEIGAHVAAALVGTFLGILLCYGLVGPISANLGKTADEEQAYYHVLRVTMNAFIKGTAPIMAVEIGRRAIPGHARPTFQEVEQNCRNTKSAEPQAAAAA